MIDQLSATTRFSNQLMLRKLRRWATGKQSLRETAIKRWHKTSRPREKRKRSFRSERWPRRRPRSSLREEKNTLRIVGKRFRRKITSRKFQSRPFPRREIWY